MSTHEEGTIYNQYNHVKDLVGTLTPVAQKQDGTIDYIPQPITITYKPKTV